MESNQRRPRILQNVCAAATISAAIDWGAEDDNTDTIFAHSRKNAVNVCEQTGLMMVVGNDDRLFHSHQRLVPYLDELKVEYDFRSCAGVGHNLGLMKQKCEQEIVLMLAQHYAAAE